MTRWEYKRLWLQDSSEVEAKLNELGSQGWELSGYSYQKSGRGYEHMCILKRGVHYGD